MACIFCVRDGDPTKSKSTFTQENRQVIEFLCQELQIDFHIFETESAALSLNFCDECCALYEKVSRIQLVLQEVKGQLAQVIQKIRDEVKKSHEEKKDDTSKSTLFSLNCRNSSKCRLFRERIMQPMPLGKPGNQSRTRRKRKAHNQETKQNKSKIGKKCPDGGGANFFDEPEIFPASSVKMEPLDYVDVHYERNEDNSMHSNPDEDENDDPVIEHEISSRDSAKKDVYSNLENGCSKDSLSSKNKFRCTKENCLKEFTVKTLLKKHLQFHEQYDTTGFGCKDCDELFHTESAWIRHMTKYHAENTDLRRTFCRFCKYKTLYPNQLRLHELAEHDTELTFTCNTCGNKYSSKSILETHLMTHSISGIYSCIICDFNTDQSDKLEQHLILFHIPKVVKKLNASEDIAHTTQETADRRTCTVCGKIFDKSRLLAYHMKKTHANEQIHLCEICPQKTFTSPSALLSHITDFHEPTMPKNLNCDKCPKKFATNFMLERHTNFHSLDSRKPLACDICDLRFSTKDSLALQRHILNIHQQKKQKKFQCTSPGCDKMFVVKVKCLQHERKCHPELLVHCCNLCDKMYSVIEFLETHMKTHGNPLDSNNKPLDCSVCKSKFSSKETLAEHLLRHTGEEKLTCPECPERFLFTIHLRLHMEQKHNAERPHSCTLCGKRCTRISDLNKHMKTHTEASQPPESHPCSEPKCGKIFSSSSKLIKHVRDIHKAPRLVQCDQCGKTIKSSTFKMHMQRHEGVKQHECQYCPKRFANGFELKIHLYTHTGEKPYVCHICQRGFTQAHSLKGHLNVHKKDGTFYPVGYNANESNVGANIHENTIMELDQQQQQQQQQNNFYPEQRQLLSSDQEIKDENDMTNLHHQQSHHSAFSNSAIDFDVLLKQSEGV